MLGFLQNTLLRPENVSQMGIDGHFPIMPPALLGAPLLHLDGYQNEATKEMREVMDLVDHFRRYVLSIGTLQKAHRDKQMAEVDRLTREGHRVVRAPIDHSPHADLLRDPSTTTAGNTYGPYGPEVHSWGLQLQLPEYGPARYDYYEARPGQYGRQPPHTQPPSAHPQHEPMVQTSWALSHSIIPGSQRKFVLA